MGCVKAAGVGGLIDVALPTLAESGTAAGVGWWVGAIRTPLTSLPLPFPPVTRSSSTERLVTASGPKHVRPSGAARAFPA